jgi:hypothetical protein
MHLYYLDSSSLIIRQGLTAKKEIDVAQIKASILGDLLLASRRVDSARAPANKLELPLPDLRAELSSLYPDLLQFSLSQTVIKRMAPPAYDTVTLFVGTFPRYLTGTERNKMAMWLKERVRTDSVKIILEREIPKK